MTIKSHSKTPVWLFALIFIYVAILAVLTVINGLGADRWWFGALNLYLPQAVWAVPGIFIFVLTLKISRQWALVPLLCLVWVAGPLMGFCWPSRLFEELPDGLPLRVMTWNVKYGTHDELAHLALIHDIDKNNPALILLQDANGALNGSLKKYLSGWNVRSYGQYVVASRLPLDELQVLPMSFPRNEHAFVRTRLRIGGTAVTIYNVHFQTPRWGLNALKAVRKKPRYLPRAVQQLEDNVAVRFIQVRTLREYISREQGPVIVAGDLNSPDASEVCATLRDTGLHDAFAEGGKGYGYTYGHFLLQHKLPAVNVSWMRIDHIMMSSRFQTRRCWVGTGEASDHRPVIADLVLF